MAGAVNFKLEGIVAAWGTSTERGFVTGRSLVINVLIIDAAPRSFAQGDPANLPCLVFFDFKASFPSVSWKRLFFLLGKAGLPDGIFNLLKAMCTRVMVFRRRIVRRSCLRCSQASCEAALSLAVSQDAFVIAINPLLIALECISPDKKQAVVTACADVRNCVAAVALSSHGC